MLPFSIEEITLPANTVSIALFFYGVLLVVKIIRESLLKKMTVKIE